MALKYMENAEMVAVSGPWVEPGSNAHGVLSGRALTAAVLAEVSSAHVRVLGLVPNIHTRLVEIQQEQGVVDDRHDVFVRGLYHRLLSEEHLADDPAIAALFRELRELMFPEGLSITNRSYRHESGHGDIVNSRLGAEHRALLSRLGTHDGNLLLAVEEYLALAARLGELDEERAQFDENTHPLRKANADARNHWIRAVTMMRMAVQMIGPEDRELAEVMVRLDRAEAQATRRYISRNGGQDDDTASGDPADIPAPDGGQLIAAGQVESAADVAAVVEKAQVSAEVVPAG
jgi:hypothetical protein